MVLWTSDKYITSIKNLPLVKNRHSSMEVMLKPTIRTNIHICVPVFLVCPILGLIWVLSSYISNVMGVILVYALWYSSIISAASDGGQKSRPTIVMYVCERKSSV